MPFNPPINNLLTTLDWDFDQYPNMTTAEAVTNIGLYIYFLPPLTYYSTRT